MYSSILTTITVVVFLIHCDRGFSQSCGIFDTSNTTILDPDVVIVTDTFMDNLPVGTIIWRARTVNIVSAAAIPDNHVKYIGGLRYTERYEYLTNAETFKFFQLETSPYITRKVVFNCTDARTVTYSFAFDILPSDIKRPEFHQSDYHFNITEDWPIDQPINFHSFILAWDDDNDLRNAELEFKVDSEASPLKLRVTSSPLWDVGNPDFKPPAAYRLDLLLDAPPPPPGSYAVPLIASSRLLSSSVNVFIEVSE